MFIGEAAYWSKMSRNSTRCFKEFKEMWPQARMSAIVYNPKTKKKKKKALGYHG